MNAKEYLARYLKILLSYRSFDSESRLGGWMRRRVIPGWPISHGSLLGLPMSIPAQVNRADRAKAAVCVAVDLYAAALCGALPLSVLGW